MTKNAASDRIFRGPRWLGRDIAARLLLHITAAALLTAFGVFQTDQSPLASRAIYWGGNLLAAAPIIAVCEHLSARAGWSARFGAVVDFGLVVAIASAVLYPVVLLFEYGVFVDPSTVFDFIDLAIAETVIIALLVLTGRAVRLAVEREIAPDENRPDVLFNRLSPKTAEGAIVALKAEDHYVRVYTETGNELVLMRFADAVESLPSESGRQTHRSWWVAARAIQSSGRKEGKHVLNIGGGLQVPVSRSYMMDIRKRGWI